MSSIAMSVFLESEFGEVTELPHAGSALEHPLVFDSTARDLHILARQGRVEIVHEHHAPGPGGDRLIDQLHFRRLQ
ncbi:MAG: hypothetical protein JO006_16225 [Paucibacter sp.]|nr:hypothetical protein [Roseateles sp.]